MMDNIIKIDDLDRLNDCVFLENFRLKFYQEEEVEDNLNYYDFEAFYKNQCGFLFQDINYMKVAATRYHAYNELKLLRQKNEMEIKLNDINYVIPFDSIVCTQTYLSKRWLWSITKVKNYLTNLEEEGFVKKTSILKRALLIKLNHKKVAPREGGRTLNLKIMK